jgi:hypothetical protein
MKQTIKRIVVLILVIGLLSNLSAPAMAANESNTKGIEFSASLSSNVIQTSSEDQTVVLNINADPEITLDTIEYVVNYNSALTLASFSCTDANLAYDSGDVNLYYGVGQAKVAWNSDSGDNITDVTNIGQITFTIPANTPAGTYEFSATGIKISQGYGTKWENTASASATLTIVDSNSNSYVASLNSSDTNLNVGDQLLVNVSVAGVGYANFASSEVVLTYDSTKLIFNKGDSNLNGATVLDQAEGMIKLEDYGEPQPFGDVYTLAFDVISDGSATVTMTSAKFSTQENAASSNLVIATLVNASVDATLTQMYSVSLPDTVTGNTSVEKGDDYTFAVKDADNYTYEVTATMDGQDVTVTDNGDGTYTVENVTGALVISVSATPKSHRVTFAGTGANDVTDKVTTATYGTAYTFTMPSAIGYAYSLDITYTGTENAVEYSIDEAGVVTIAGDKITGNITITIGKTQTDANMSVEGSGASDVTLPERATPGTDFTFTVTKDNRYDYVVTVTVNGEVVTPTEGENGQYTIAGSSFDKGDNIKISVVKTVKTDNVTVSKYVTVDESQMWLITINTTKMDGSVYTYNGENMFWSEKYNNGNGAYCYLVVATEQPAVVASDLAIVTGSATNVNYGMDVNMTGTVDANDAQLTYNMYKPYYSDFTDTVTMEKFLRADVNGDGEINVKDAQVIVNHLFG